MIIKMNHEGLDFTINADVKCFFEDELPLGCPLLPKITVKVKEVCIKDTDILGILDKDFVKDIEKVIRDAHNREFASRMCIQS